jgi:hypothetical protein
MRALVWITEAGWEAAVDAAALLGPAADVTLLHVTSDELAPALHGPEAGLLGRHRRPPPPGPTQVERAIEGEADELLAAAARRLGRPAERERRTGRVEHTVVAAAAGFDVLVLARDGEPRPGPKSLAQPNRFVLDHAACRVLLAEPDRLPPR